MQKMFFTIDVEDWFQVENLKEVIQGEWDNREVRVGHNTYLLLELLDKYKIKATFFVLGWVAERCPELIRKIFLQGHEIASHGCNHQLVYNQLPEEFREDIKRSKSLLEDIIGQEILGYRAPSFSIADWAIDILVEEGFKYDSSYYPFGGSRYGKLDLSKAEKDSNSNIYKLPNGLYEIPATTLKIFGKVLPWSGGGYFRLLPYSIFEWGFKKAINQVGSGIFYIHPWEIDLGQPRLKGLKKGLAFRHYINLEKTYGKLESFIARNQENRLRIDSWLNLN